jgi:hypothetical protein
VLAQAQKHNEKLTCQTEIVQVGQANSNQMMEDLNQHGINANLISHGHLSRSETISALSATHAVYLGMSQPEGLQFVPGRVYDLLASGRSIISNAAPQSEIAQVITGTGNGWCYALGDIQIASQKYIELAQLTLSGSSRITPLPDYAKPYGSRRQAEQFAKVFDQIV